MHTADMDVLCAYAKQFSGLDEEKIKTLHRAYPQVSQHIHQVTDCFYTRLQTIPQSLPFLKERVDTLKATHSAWLHELFSGQFDAAYTAKLYHVGDVHVKVKLPVEFMAGAMTIIQSELIHILGELYAADQDRMLSTIRALNAATGFSLLIMQESYQSSSMAEELENFLKITGMSRVLFNNLARSYR